MAGLEQHRNDAAVPFNRGVRANLRAVWKLFVVLNPLLFRHHYNCLRRLEGFLRLRKELGSD